MNFLITLIIAVVGYRIAKFLKIPVPAMLGSMFLVGIYSGFTNNAFTPSFLIIIIHAIAGTFIGADIEMEDIKGFKKLAKPLLLLLLMYTLNTFITGYIIYSFSDLDLITALFSSVSGSVTDISIISMNLGADSATVALMQTSRVILTLALYPPWIAFTTKNLAKDSDLDIVVNNKGKTKKKANNKKLIFTITIAILASYVGSFFSFSASTLIMSTFVIGFLNIKTDQIYINIEMKTIVQVLAGALIGSTITQKTLIGIPKLFFPIVVLISSYFIINFIYSYICPKIGWLDKKNITFCSQSCWG